MVLIAPAVDAAERVFRRPASDAHLASPAWSGGRASAHSPARKKEGSAGRHLGGVRRDATVRRSARADRIRYRRHDDEVFLYAFDLIELNGDDLRRDPLAVRKAALERLLARAASGLRYNEHLDKEDGPRDFPYSSGRSPYWVKSRKPTAPAVKREPEEDWGKWKS